MISSPTSVNRPGPVTGLGICDEIVSSWTVAKNIASVQTLIFPPVAPFSNSYIASVPRTSAASVIDVR